MSRTLAPARTRSGLGLVAWLGSRGYWGSCSPAARANGSVPLTADRAKPAVPFGGNYRLIDFVLSNLVNAGYLRICVLTQYKSHSLDRHITQTWRMSDAAGQLRHAGAGAAAARPALVHRQRRRDPAVAEPDLRRPSRLHRGVRRRPRVPDGPAPDGRAAHRVRGGRDRRRAAGAARGGERVRRHRRRHRPQGARVPREAGEAAGPAGQPGRDVRVDGQLRLHHRGVAGRVARGRRGRGLRARHGRRRSCR